MTVLRKPNRVEFSLVLFSSAVEESVSVVVCVLS